MNNKNLGNRNEETIDLVELGKAILEKWFLVCIGTLVGILCMGIYTWKIVEPLYQASAMIYIRGTENTISSLQDLQIGAALTDDYEVIFKSRPILEEVIEEVGLEITYKELRGKIEISNPRDTRILNIVVTDKSPELATQIVNCLAVVSMDTVKEIDAKEPYLIEKAVVDWEVISPSPMKNLVSGALIGCALTMGWVMMNVLLNEKVGTVEEVEKIMNIPVLCIIPESKSCNYDEFDKRRYREKRSM